MNPFLQNGGGSGYNYSYRHGETKEEYIRRNFQVSIQHYMVNSKYYSGTVSSR
jgi:hypothetical protein